MQEAEGVRAQRRDISEIGIVEALERMGYQVERMYVPCPFDLLVSRPSRSPLKLPLECKTPGGRVSEDQAEYFALYPDCIVYTPDDAVYAANKYL
jgi:hypothetical protein